MPRTRSQVQQGQKSTNFLGGVKRHSVFHPEKWGTFRGGVRKEVGSKKGGVGMEQLKNSQGKHWVGLKEKRESKLWAAKLVFKRDNRRRKSRKKRGY